MSASSANIPVKPERPVDNLKFTAYKKIVDSYEEACELIRKKKPVLGEPIVVPYYSDKEAGTIQLLFGIGSADIEAPYMRSSENNFIGDDILITASPSLLKSSVIMLLQENVFTPEEFMDELSSAYGLSINPTEVEYLLGLPAGTLAINNIIDLKTIQLKRNK